MSRSEQKIGKAGEELARVVLERLGVQQLEKIGTPVTVIRNPRTGKISGAFYGEPVLGDYRGVFPVTHEDETGCTFTLAQSVVVEVKTLDHNLRWSYFRDHQPAGLSAHDQIGGISLVAWVHSTGVYVLRWPIDGFGPGRGLDVETASNLALETLT